MGRNADIVRRVFDAFTRRDVEALLALCDREIVFVPPTGRLAGRDEPYRGHEGLRTYMADVARVWQELRSEPDEYVELDDRVLCTGRVYAWGVGRVIDAPAGWVWRGGRGGGRGGCGGCATGWSSRATSTRRDARRTRRSACPGRPPGPSGRRRPRPGPWLRPRRPRRAGSPAREAPRAAARRARRRPRPCGRRRPRRPGACRAQRAPTRRRKARRSPSPATP